MQTVKRGAIEFLEKPFTEERLLEALHSAFRVLKDRPRSRLEPVRLALEEGHIVPHYQPKVHLRTGRIMGFEALLRWVKPGSCENVEETIREAFEDERLGTALSQKMLNLIVRDISNWRAAGLAFGQVSFNAAPRDLEDPSYSELLLELITRKAVSPSALQVEVLETVALNPESHHVRETLERLSCAGLSVALDDFGTGYASLTHLRSLPVDTIKIDRSFVASLHEVSSQSIVRAITGLCQGLGKEVVAEGVETNEQCQLLAGIGCDTGQGFLFGRAVGPEEVPQLLRSRPVGCPAR